MQSKEKSAAAKRIEKAYPFLYMGMDLLNSQYDQMMCYTHLASLSVPMDEIFSKYANMEADTLVHSSHNDEEENEGPARQKTTEESLIRMKRDKRREQMQRRIRSLIKYENQIDDQQEDAHLVELYQNED